MSRDSKTSFSVQVGNGLQVRTIIMHVYERLNEWLNTNAILWKKENKQKNQLLNKKLWHWTTRRRLAIVIVVLVVIVSESGCKKFYDEEDIHKICTNTQSKEHQRKRQNTS